MVFGSRGNVAVGACSSCRNATDTMADFGHIFLTPLRNADCSASVGDSINLFLGLGGVALHCISCSRLGRPKSISIIRAA